jgi:hypothetical protein
MHDAQFPSPSGEGLGVRPEKEHIGQEIKQLHLIPIAPQYPAHSIASAEKFIDKFLKSVMLFLWSPLIKKNSHPFIAISPIFP